MEAVAAWAAGGGGEGQVARGGPVGTATRRRYGCDRRSVRTRAGRCRFERVRSVALGRAQFTDPNCFPFFQIVSKLCNSNSLRSQVPKIFKLCKVLDLMGEVNWWWWSHPNRGYHLVEPLPAGPGLNRA
jgi:hypothetical protein